MLEAAVGVIVCENIRYALIGACLVIISYLIFRIIPNWNKRYNYVTEKKMEHTYRS